MTLQEKIVTNVKDALRSKNTVVVGTLRMLTSQIHNREIEKRAKGQTDPLTDDEVLEIIAKEVKKRREASDVYASAGQIERKEQELAELAILNAYLPEQMSSEELHRVIDEIISESGASGEKEFGKVMGLVAARIKGKGDVKAASARVRERLQKAQ